MCKATLLPDPDSPLTRINLMVWCSSRSFGAVDLAGLARLGGVLVGLLFLVLEHAAVELVGQQVYGGVHVLFGGIGMDGAAAHMQGGFGLLSELLHRQDTMHVDHVIEMPGNALELLLHVGAHGRGYFDMVTGKRQLHDASPFLAYLLTLISFEFIWRRPWPCARWKAQGPVLRDTWRPFAAPRRFLRPRAARRCGCRKAGWSSLLP